MKILFAASEAAPFAKTGGLADVAGSLPPALASLGNDMRLIMPRYQCVDPNALKLKEIASFDVPLGAWKERCLLYETVTESNVTVYFVEKKIFYDRPELYGTSKADYPDNAERFTFFSRAVLEACVVLDFKPDIIHCHDWQTGLIPLYLKKAYADTEQLRKTKSVFTIHNMGYQGLFPPDTMRLIGLGWDLYTPAGIEYWGKVNFLKAGLLYADCITTVSESYSREIQTKEYGHGLEGVLLNRGKDLSGIINGIDYAAYDPARDSGLSKKFSASRLAGRDECRDALKKNLGLRGEAPIVGMVTRLADQKGLDILVQALPEIMSLDVQLVILGTGDAVYHTMLKEAAAQFPERMNVVLQYNESIARSIYAGCDFFLMPSRYEPCGLGQMIALRYGAVPIVRKTGGLADTVVEFNPKTGTGTGFLFDEYSASALLRSLQRALRTYQDKTAWKKLIQNGMKQDFSWTHSAEEYVKLYKKLMKKK